MKRHNLAPRRKRSFKSTTDSKHKLPVAPNILNREFNTKKPNVAWVSDITYIETKEGWLYLAVFIDLYSRRVVGWAAKDTMTAELVLDAYREGTTSVGQAPLLVHSDRGSQYASHKFKKALRATNCIQSMSRKGEC
jgi:putative transposase